MKRLLFLATVLIAAFFLNSCNHQRRLTSQTEALFRNKWELTEVEGQQVANSIRSSFEFTPGKLSGSTGCNQLSARFIAGKHQAVTFIPEDPVKVECKNENAAAWETRFLEALSKSTKWDIDGSELWLGNGNVTLIKLRRL